MLQTLEMKQQLIPLEVYHLLNQSKWIKEADSHLFFPQ